MSLIDTMGQDSIFQKRLAEIMAMPDGPEKEEELRQLSLDYPGMLEDLGKQREFAEGMAGSESPRGGVAGPASNPFSYYVAASPVEHAASGMKQYMGHKERKDIQGQIDATRAQSQGQVQKALKSALPPNPQPPNPQLQQAQAGMLRGIGIPDTGIRLVEGAAGNPFSYQEDQYLSPEEKRKRMMALFGRG